MDARIIQSIRLTSLLIIIYSILLRCNGDELQVITHPQDASVKTGGNVTLECKFNMAVTKCMWLQDYFKVLAIGKYNIYADQDKNGTNTDNCTLIINTFSRAIDANCFYCVGFGAKSVNYSSVASRKACLSAAPPFVSGDDAIIVNPQDAIVREGDSVTLSCVSRIPVLSCEWLRNDRIEAHPIRDRYEYIKFGKEPNSSRDCSIRINQFKAIDAVRWMCAAVVAKEGAFDVLKSNWAKLTWAAPKTQESAPTTPGSTCAPGQTRQATATAETLKQLPVTETKTGQSNTTVIIGTLTLVLVLIIICLLVAAMYIMKYRIQGYRSDALNL